MSQSHIVLPAAAQALLSIVVLVMLGPARARSMREARQTLDDAEVRIGRNTWSEQALKVSNNYRNQFELPVLFFAVVAYALILRQADAVMIGLAWGFVASRVVHAVIHIGPNVVKWRGLVFIGGATILVAMWAMLGWRVLAGSA